MASHWIGKLPGYVVGILLGLVALFAYVVWRIWAHGQHHMAIYLALALMAGALLLSRTSDPPERQAK